jgi:GAF domain-containing protein
MRLGSLCVIDTEPRHLDAEQLMVLANFAEVVVREIEKDIARVRTLYFSPLCICRVPQLLI